MPDQWIALGACAQLALVGFLRLPRGGWLVAPVGVLAGWLVGVYGGDGTGSAFIGTAIGAFVVGVGFAIFGRTSVKEEFVVGVTAAFWLEFGPLAAKGPNALALLMIPAFLTLLVLAEAVSDEKPPRPIAYCLYLWSSVSLLALAAKWTWSAWTFERGPERDFVLGAFLALAFFHLGSVLIAFPNDERASAMESFREIADRYRHASLPRRRAAAAIALPLACEALARLSGGGGAVDLARAGWLYALLLWAMR